MTQPSIENNAALVPEGENGLPVYMDVPLDGASSTQAAKHQYLTLDPSTGLAALGDDALPSQISAGYVRVSERTDFSTTDGNARARVSWGLAVHQAPSTIASDTPGTADIGKPLWLAPDSTPGLLSHTGTTFAGTLKNRSLLGLMLGKVKEGASAIHHWVGPIAQAVARGVMLADGATAGSVAYPVDSGATVDIGSASVATAAILMPRAKLHGVITSIEIVPSAALSATSGNDRTITVWKIDTLGVNAAVSVGTFTTTTALVAQTVALFTLSATAGALNMLETDILGYSTVHASSGAVIPQSAIRANMRAI